MKQRLERIKGTLAQIPPAIADNFYLWMYRDDVFWLIDEVERLEAECSRLSTVESNPKGE